MRLWSIWNLLSSFLYFVGMVFGFGLACLLVVLFVPPFFAALLICCVLAGIVLAVVGIIAESRGRRHDETHGQKTP